MTCLKTILAKKTLNKPFIQSYFASSISGEVKYYLLTHLITFRNKNPTKTHKNPKWQNLNFWVFANPGLVCDNAVDRIFTRGNPDNFRPFLGFTCKIFGRKK